MPHMLQGSILSLLLVLLVLWPFGSPRNGGGGSGSAFADAAVVKIGVMQTVSASFGFEAYSGYQTVFGLQAAIDDANSANALGVGNSIQLIVKDVVPIFGGAQNETISLLFADQVSALVLPNYYAAFNALYTSMATGAPVIGAIGADPQSLFSTAAKTVINYRFSFKDETSQMINIALNSRLRCKRFALFYYNETGVAKLKDDAIAQLASLGHTDVVAAEYGWEALTTDDDVSPTVDPRWNATIAKLMSNKPHCILTLADAGNTQNMASDVVRHPNWRPDSMAFILPSVGNSPVFSVPEMLGRTYVVQQYPSPEDDDYTIVANYRRSVARLNRKGVYDPVGNMTGLSFDTHPNYYALEGYIIGRFTVEILKRAAGNYTWAGLLSAVYDSRMFALDDVTLGPYSRECVGKQALAGIPCYCNSGNKLLYTSYLGLDGLLHSFVPDYFVGETDSVTQLTMPLSSCEMPLGSVTTPTLFISVVQTPSLTPAVIPQVQEYQSFLFVTLNIIANAGLGRQRSGNLVAVTEYVNDLSNATLQTLVDRYPMAAFAGGYQTGELNVTGVTAISGYNNGRYQLSDPNVKDFRVESIVLDPVLADLAHALVAKLDADVKSTKEQPAGILLLATSEDELSLGRSSLHTFQFSPTESLRANWTVSKATQLVAELTARGYPALTRDDGSHVLFVVSQDQDFVQTVVRFAVIDAPYVRVFVATSEEILEAVVDGFTTVERTITYFRHHNVFFASVFRVFWYRSGTYTDPSTSLEAYDVILTATGMHNHTLARLRGLRHALALWSAQDSLLDTISAARYTHAWYEAGTISVLDENYGRFFSAECTPDVIQRNDADRTCRCNKGPQRFFVHSFSDWAKLSSPQTVNLTFEYVLPFCGVKYFPLVLPTEVDVWAAAGSAVGVSLLVIGIIACTVVGLTQQKRDNKFAPKDSKQPFTIAFTDIQSSTSLWARIPQEMGDAVDTHHALIRDLIKEHKGYEVKTIGDSFMVAFSNPHSAARFALDLQTAFFNHDWNTDRIDGVYCDLEREKAEEAALENAAAAYPTETASPLADAPGNLSFDAPSVDSRKAAMDAATSNSLNPAFWKGLRVRVGIHHGSGEIKHDQVTLGYDYYGTVVNTAARVEGVGNGGQVLLTEAAFEAAGGHTTEGFAVPDAVITPLGPQPLRGLDAPVVLYQVIPAVLNGRQFHALRLDIERDVESETEETASETGSQRSQQGVNITPEIIAERACRRWKGDMHYLSTLNSIMNHHRFVAQLFRTTAEKKKREALDAIALKWRVPLKKAADKSMTAQSLWDRHLMSVVLKVYPTLDKEQSAGIQRRASLDGSSESRPHSRATRRNSEIGDRQISVDSSGFRLESPRDQGHVPTFPAHTTPTGGEPAGLPHVPPAA